MLKIFFSLLLAATALGAADTKPQVILLKLDDVVSRHVGKSPVSLRWQKIADYLKLKNVVFMTPSEYLNSLPAK